MIAEGTDVFGLRALVTTAPFVVEGSRYLHNHWPEVGAEVAIVDTDEGGHVWVVTRDSMSPGRLHRDCLTIIPTMPAPAAPITPEVAAHVLWHYRQLGYPPGSFVSDLIRTIGSADQGNRRLLGRGFPAYVRAVNLAAEERDGIDRLRRVMETRTPL